MPNTTTPVVLFDNNQVVLSHIKWAGSKLKLVPTICPAIIDEIYAILNNAEGDTGVHYFEPFAGTAIIGLTLANILGESLLSRNNLSSFHFYDKNPYLVELMHAVQIPQPFAEDDIREYNCASGDLRAKLELFHKWRNEFNSLVNEKGESRRRAELFWLLNQACYNGLFRVNRSGFFNVPFGSRVNLPDINSGEFLGRLQRLRKIFNSDLRLAFKAMTAPGRMDDYCSPSAWVKDVVEPTSSFIYCDPPYMAKDGEEKVFTAYTPDGWTQHDLYVLCVALEFMHKDGAHWMMSNSDAIVPILDSLFLGDVAKDLFVYQTGVRRSISADVKSRGKVNEVVITNFESRSLEPLRIVWQ